MPSYKLIHTILLNSNNIYAARSHHNSIHLSHLKIKTLMVGKKKARNQAIYTSQIDAITFSLTGVDITTTIGTIGLTVDVRLAVVALYVRRKVVDPGNTLLESKKNRRLGSKPKSKEDIIREAANLLKSFTNTSPPIKTTKATKSTTILIKPLEISRL